MAADGRPATLVSVLARVDEDLAAMLYGCPSARPLYAGAIRHRLDDLLARARPLTWRRSGASPGSGERFVSALEQLAVDLDAGLATDAPRHLVQVLRQRLVTLGGLARRLESDADDAAYLPVASPPAAARRLAAARRSAS